MSSAALVGTDGSVDWCCFPRFDSPSVFAAILDPEIGGHFRIAPTGPILANRQEYLPDTNILETTFTTSTGVVSITDFMPAADDDDNNPETPPNALHEIHRIVTCLSGEVELRCDFQPRHDYARARPLFHSMGGRSGGAAVLAGGGRQTLMLLASIPLPFDDRGVNCSFTLAQGQTETFVLAYGHGRPASVERLHTAEKLDYTRSYWQGLVARMNYRGLWRDAVVRSFLVLHLIDVPAHRSHRRRRRRPACRKPLGARATGTTASRGCAIPPSRWIFSTVWATSMGPIVTSGGCWNSAGCTVVDRSSSTGSAPTLRSRNTSLAIWQGTRAPVPSASATPPRGIFRSTSMER